jgi:V/A-type H+/Na+-transporting ATPase subunit K
MFWLIALMTLGLVGMVVAGLLMELRPQLRPAQRWLKPLVASNLGLFVVAQGGLLLFGVHEALAVGPEGARELAAGLGQAVKGGQEISIGYGLALIGIGLPTAFSTIAAGIAVGPIGAASLAALAEKPEIFGRTLVYLGLAEGIAIYGLVMSILLLDRI